MIKKIINYIPPVFGVLLLAWVAFSWVDIVSDNCTVSAVHSNINFFYLLAKGAIA